MSKKYSTFITALFCLFIFGFGIALVDKAHLLLQLIAGGGLKLGEREPGLRSSG